MPISAKPSARPQCRIWRARCARSTGSDEGAAVVMAQRQTGRVRIIEVLQRYLPDPDATARAGALLAPGLRGGMVLTLCGELGAGKTTLVRGLLRALGWAGPV